ncbi:MAG: TSUP family transporter [Candidatus Lokiarchaeota archaeon]
MELILWIIIIAFLFETMDSAAGMGFGTGLSPLLLTFGYSPLQVVPVLLISEAITGVTDAVFDHELKNVHYSFRPLNDTTKVSFIIAGSGVGAITISVILAYYAIQFPSYVIKSYVAMSTDYNPKALIAFSALAGFNKGIGGGGYGPIVTLGQIYSGIYEKSATAIVSFAEGLVSIAGIFVFFFISYIGINIDLILLPSIFTGGFLAAIVAPYIVRVFPNKIWKFIIPVYACGMGIFLLLELIFKF